MRGAAEADVDLLTIGETMAALSPDRIGPLRHAGRLALGVAGSESTVAIGAARLGARTAWVGRVGDDELGRLVTSTVRGEGTEVHAVIDPEAPTGLMMKERRATGVRRVHYYRNGSAGSRMCPGDLPDLVGRARIVHTSGITLALSDSAADTAVKAMERARAAGAVVSFDVNYRSRLATPAAARVMLDRVMPLVDVLFSSIEDLSLLGVEGGEVRDSIAAAQATTARGPSVVVVTKGADGGFAARRDVVAHMPSPKVVECDPVGAGDSFIAGFLTGLLDGADDEGCLALGVRTGAISVTTEGDWEGLPTRAELGLVDLPPGSVSR